MEALIAAVAELIIVPLALFAAVFANGLAAFAAGLASLLETVFGITLGFNRKKGDSPLSAEAQEAGRLKAQRRRSFMKRLAVTLGSILAVILLIITVVNAFFYPAAIRWVLARVEKQTDIKIEFTSASGNLFTGELKLSGVAVRRDGNAVSNFDLHAEELALDLQMTKLLARTPRLEKFFLSGLKGDFHRVSAPERVRVRKHFRVDHLRVENLDLLVRDRSRAKEADFAVKIASLECEPFRSRFAVFDVLFRTNARGEIAGRPFLIQMQKTEHGRETVWQADGLPVAFVGQYVGGPFDWLQGGTVDVQVEDKWARGEAGKIELNWSFILRDLVVVAPEGVTPASRLVSSAIAEYLRQNAEKLEVSFSLSLSENQFEGAASVGAAGLWDATRDGLIKELSRISGVTTHPAIKTGVDFLRQRLEDSRKKSP